MKSNRFVLTALGSLLLSLSVNAQTLTLQIDKADRSVSPTLYGLMTEEINYSYEGGLYAQLLRDPAMRELQEIPRAQGQQQQRRRMGGMQKPRAWVPTDTLNVTCRFVNNGFVVNNSATQIANTRYTRHNSLSIETKKANEGIENNGFWGIAIKADTKYTGSINIKGDSKVTVGLKSAKTGTVYASQTFTVSGNTWQEKKIDLTTGTTDTETENGVFFVLFDKAGTYEIAYPTLFPPTFNNREHGLRSDLMTMMKDMHPKFLRFPGGNYLEGNKFNERFDWKRTIGPLTDRPGHQSPWGYWSTDGMGLLEFLTWAEDVGAEPILGVFAGYVLQGDYVEGDAVEPFIKEALEEIEYVIGGPETKWGARRIQDGHAQPFPLHYVEIGNEDFFDRSGSYSHRFEQFYTAIKAKYPQLQIISTQDEKTLRANSNDPQGLKVDVIDEHYYRNTEGMYRAAQQYDSYDRNGTKIFCGEWASREGDPTTNMNAALGDAAWMTCMERNSDILIAHCYAPLFVNVSQEGDDNRYAGMQWKSDLIGYDAFSAFGSPSYYAQCMFSNYLGDKVIPIQSADIPNMHYGNSDLPQLYYVATTDTSNGTIYLKVVNGGSTKVNVKLNISGKKVSTSKSEQVVLKAAKPEDTNSIDNPKNIVPVTSKLKVKNGGAITIEPYSVNVYVLK